ncbi:unnamed protein product [Agarophyton chilense]
MPLPPIFAIGGFGGVTLAVTVLIVRRIARKPRKKCEPSQQLITAAKLDNFSTIGDLVKTENFLHSCSSNRLICTSTIKTPEATDSISARSAAIIESHQVTASVSLLPKSISTLSSVTYDSKVCVDTYAALLTNDDDDEDGAFDDAKTCTDDLESEAKNRMRDIPAEHEEIAVPSPTALLLIDNSRSDGDTESGTESGTPLVHGEYEQNDEQLLQPRSPILRQQTSPVQFEREASEAVSSEPSYFNNSMYDLDYEAEIDVRMEPENSGVPSIFTENATVSHGVGDNTQYYRSAVLIFSPPRKSYGAPVSVTAAPLASVPALEDVVTGTPIPATEIRIDTELLDTTNESQQEQDANEPSISNEQESMDDDSTTTDEESNYIQDTFMNDLPTILREGELDENESNDVQRDCNNTQIVSVPRFRQPVSDSHGPILPIVSREKSTLSSPERTDFGSPAATRPLREKDVEQVRAMTNIDAIEDSEKENAFQSTSTSPERLSRKPWRSDRLNNVFSRKNSVRRLRIPERIRRRQLRPQKQNTKSL